MIALELRQTPFIQTVLASIVAMIASAFIVAAELAKTQNLLTQSTQRLAKVRQADAFEQSFFSGEFGNDDVIKVVVDLDARIATYWISINAYNLKPQAGEAHYLLWLPKNGELRGVLTKNMNMAHIQRTSIDTVKITVCAEHSKEDMLLLMKATAPLPNRTFFSAADIEIPKIINSNFTMRKAKIEHLVARVQ